MRVFLQVIFILLAAIPCSARTWIVDQGGDGDFAVVREALIAASAGDSILIHPGTYDEYDGLDNWITLEHKPLTLMGTGIAPEQTALRLSVNFRHSDGCVVENLLFFGEGSPLAFNAGIDGGQLTVRRCRFEQNESISGGGGAIRVAHGDVTVEDCTFLNTSTDPVYELSRGGAIVCGAGICTVRRSRFLSNESGGWGGAIFAFDPVVIEECIFFRNKADQGAAVMAYCADTIARCTFLLNEVRFGAGAALEAWADCWSNPISHCIVARTIRNGGEWNATMPRISSAAMSGETRLEITKACGAGTLSGKGTSADPLFCDEVNGDVRLAEGSPCLPGQHGPVALRPHRGDGAGVRGCPHRRVLSG